nr:PREDICTED: RNA 3'-terminal phosphate cyclase isoform X1 [Bemisia tabaci]XP_018909375.1 PREDICTED: RNA 3'-terminal phosphate cyclase isoform X1 [Bemisia tabaci]
MGIQGSIAEVHCWSLLPKNRINLVSRKICSVQPLRAVENSARLKSTMELDTTGCALIDGSLLEGGGQILRTAVALSALKDAPVRIIKIRAGRKDPGLKSQHLKGIELVRQMCDGSLEGGSMGSTEITFRPGRIKAGSFYADAVTAGSVSLMMQVLLPLALFAPGPTNFELKGGTNADLAPPVDHTVLAYRHMLEKFGGDFKAQIKTRGYFPKGRGEVLVSVSPVRSLKGVTLTDFGEVKRVFGFSFVSGKFPSHLADSMTRYVERVLKNDPVLRKNCAEIKSTSSDKAFGDGFGIVLGCETTTGCLLVTSSCNKRGYRAEDAAKEAVEELVSSVNIQSCVDQHTQDQVIILMALAVGESKLRTGPITMHTKTVMHFTEKLLGVKFAVYAIDDEVNIIECTGSGFQNPNF